MPFESSDNRIGRRIMRDDEAYGLVMLAAILGGVGTGAMYGWECGVIAFAAMAAIIGIARSKGGL